MLSQLQDHLTNIYRVDPGHDVNDFLITDPFVAKTIAGGALVPDTEETVLVQQDDDGFAMSVFLDQAVLTRLIKGNPLQTLAADQLADLWTVLEGVSHFSYLAWSARKNREVSLLELEMQAEIDKFVSALFIALHQEDSELATNMHRHLFDQISFHPALSSEERARYSTANDYAARFCHRLHEKLSAFDKSAMRELRRFYRFTERQKISYIHSQAFSA